MKWLTVIFVLILTHTSRAQGPGEFHVYSGFGDYKLGAIRSVPDTNIYLQSVDPIYENGKVKHVYLFKDLNKHPYELHGIKFQSLNLFYESDRLVRADLVRTYGEYTKTYSDSLRKTELMALYDIINELSGVKGRKKILTKNDFILARGYQWKKFDSIMELKNYNLLKTPGRERMLIISIRYKGY